jgi:hypothetical protein
MTKLRNRNKTKRRHHVTKRRSHRTRSQRGGGDWLSTFSFGLLGNSEEPVGSGTTTWYEWATDPAKQENMAITDSIKQTIDDVDAKVGEIATTTKDVIVNEASELTEKAKSLISGEENEKLYSSPYPTPTPSPPSPVYGTTGGKSRKHKNRKGGSNLGLLYYATPVNSVSMKGGKRHKYSCCKNKGKGKRHKHNASCSRK